MKETCTFTLKLYPGLTALYEALVENDMEIVDTNQGNSPLNFFG